MSQLRITGMASGLEVDEMVKELMDAERTRLYSYQQDKEWIEWQQEAYNSVSSKYANFVLNTRDSFGFSSTTMIGHVNSSTINGVNWTKQTNVSMPNSMNVTATQDSANGSYKIAVKQLAENYSTVSQASMGSADTSATNLVDQFAAITGTDVISFTITTHEGTKEFDYTDLANTSMEAIVDDINNANIGVNATYDETLDRFFFQTEDTGTNAYVQVSDSTTTNPAPTVNFFTGASSLTDLDLVDAAQNAGKNAIFNYNGVEDLEQQNNSFTMNGIQFNFTDTTYETVLQTNGVGDLEEVDVLREANVNISTNVDAVFDKVKEFVDSYNEMMNFVNGLINEDHDRDFDPLNSKEKEELSESELKTYMEKAKKGVIENDITISTITSQLREAIINEVSGTGIGQFTRMSDIGIANAGLSDGGKNGLLVIDEDKLRSSIADDVDSVMELMFKQPEDTTLTTTYEKNLDAAQVDTKRSESGLFNRISDIISNGLTSVIGKAGYGSDDSIYRDVNGEIMLNFALRYSSTSTLDGRKVELSTQITSLEAKMTEIEDNYYQMFARMESSLSKLNSQAAWIQGNMM
jgi:flagellar hook-associated protein 2